MVDKCYDKIHNQQTKIMVKWSINAVTKYTINAGKLPIVHVRWSAHHDVHEGQMNQLQKFHSFAPMRLRTTWRALQHKWTTPVEGWKCGITCPCNTHLSLAFEGVQPSLPTPGIMGANSCLVTDPRKGRDRARQMVWSSELFALPLNTRFIATQLWRKSTVGMWNCISSRHGRGDGDLRAQTNFVHLHWRTHKHTSLKLEMNCICAQMQMCAQRRDGLQAQSVISLCVQTGCWTLASCGSKSAPVPIVLTEGVCYPPPGVTTVNSHKLFSLCQGDPGCFVKMVHLRKGAHSNEKKP